jgi:hypothetical protein
MLKGVFACVSVFLECAAGGLAACMLVVGIALAADAGEIVDWMGQNLPYLWLALSIPWLPFVVWRRGRKAHA